jgi:UPF0755 protein
VRRAVKVIAAVLALAVAGLIWGGWAWQREFFAPGPLAEAKTVVVPKGSGLAATARLLAESGVVAKGWVLIVGARLFDARPRAGEYLFPAHVSPDVALGQMAEGRTVVHKLTVAEGLTVRRVLDQVREADYLTGDIGRRPAEGSLLPETWYLSRDDTRDEVVARMEKSMRQAIDAAWAGRAAGLPLKTKEEAVVLASIVERETGLASERPHVAAVFLNRLRKGMRLQSDPTVIYGLSDGLGVIDRPLMHDDLTAAHPWNTYVIDALPPTPIANPGRASIEAVLHPAVSNDLYFVADGTGGHVFAATLEAHNANVANWRRIERSRRDR